MVDLFACLNLRKTLWCGVLLMGAAACGGEEFPLSEIDEADGGTIVEESSGMPDFFRQSSLTSEAGQALLVVGGTSLGAGDLAAKAHLEEIGFCVMTATITVAADVTALTQPKLLQKDLLVLSESISLPPTNGPLSDALGAQFKNLRVPMVVNEPFLFDDLGMTGGITNFHLGSRNSQFQISITNPGHPLAAGFSSGPQGVYLSPSGVGWGRPSAAAVLVASVIASPDRQAIFAYLAGDVMVAGTATAARVGLFVDEDYHMTDEPDFPEPNGWSLFEAAALFASSRTIQPNPNAANNDGDDSFACDDCDDGRSEQLPRERRSL